MTFKNVETGETKPNKNLHHHLNSRRTDVVEDDAEPGESFSRVVVDVDGTREEWVRVDDEAADGVADGEQAPA